MPIQTTSAHKIWGVYKMTKISDQTLGIIIDLVSMNQDPEEIRKKLGLSQHQMDRYLAIVDRKIEDHYFAIGKSGYKLLMQKNLESKLTSLRKLENVEQILVAQIYEENKDGTIKAKDISKGSASKAVYQLAQISGVLNTLRSDIETSLHDSVMPIAWERITRWSLEHRGRELEAPPDDDIPTVHLSMFAEDIESKDRQQ